MADAYRRHGGLASSSEVVELLRQHSGQPLSTLARWIVNREVVRFSQGGEEWLPLFQFAAGAVSPGTHQVVTELVHTFDDSEIASWFVLPNDLLGQASPLAIIETDTSRVLSAARTVRLAAE